MDKTYWQAIADNDYAVPADQSVESLIPELLAALGSPDFELRDVLAYSILERWVSRDLYSADELRAIIAQLTPNLAVGLGEVGSDSAFLRAFSALMLAEIVYYETNHPFFQETEAQQLLDQAVIYFTAEQDLRAYIPGPGWIHAVAHGSDLLAALALQHHLGAIDLERIMDAIASKVAPHAAHAYLYNEDQRMLRALLFALKRDLLSSSFLTSWLDRIAHYEGREVGVAMLFDGASPAITSEVKVYVLHNTKQFLHGLYYHLVTDEQLPAAATDLLPQIRVALKPMDVA
jgi:hypothetical protein